MRCPANCRPRSTLPASGSPRSCARPKVLACRWRCAGGQRRSPASATRRRRAAGSAGAAARVSTHGLSAQIGVRVDEGTVPSACRREAAPRRKRRSPSRPSARSCRRVGASQLVGSGLAEQLGARQRTLRRSTASGYSARPPGNPTRAALSWMGPWSYEFFVAADDNTIDSYLVGSADHDAAVLAASRSGSVARRSGVARAATSRSTASLRMLSEQRGQRQRRRGAGRGPGQRNGGRSTCGWVAAASSAALSTPS